MKRASLILAALALLVMGTHDRAVANPMLSAHLTGAAEAPGPGDPDGSGDITIGISPGGRELCFVLNVSNIATPTAAHIHRAPAGQPGTVVVPITPLTGNYSQGCVAVDSKLLKEIMQNPERFYVNVHNSEYPAGAIRGQLSR